MAHGETDFIGTTDDMTFTMRVSNTVAYRLAPAYDPFYKDVAPNVIGGSRANTVSAGLFGITIGGGGVTGHANIVSRGGTYATIGGGLDNIAYSSYATIGGGYGNSASGYDSTVGGGYANIAIGNDSAIGGGKLNTTTDSYTTVAGGDLNSASGLYATVGGGIWNRVNGINSTISGGGSNSVNGSVATISGAGSNTANGDHATIGGGDHNTANGSWSIIPGGYSNAATMTYTFAAGQQAQAINGGAFVWADSTNAPFASAGNDQFLIRANGGVGINTNAPQATLDISGSLRVNTGGSVFIRIQAGTSSVPTSTVASTVFTVTFPSAFSTAPRVIAMPRGQDYDDTFVVTTRHITTTYAVFNVIRIDQSADWTLDLQLDWFAWE